MTLGRYIQESHEAVAVFSISAGAFAVGEFLQVLRLRRDVPAADRRAELLFRVLFFSGILVLPVCLSKLTGAVMPGRVPFLLGAVIAWTGLLLRWWSFVALGRYFTAVLKTSADQPVVDRGPYRVLRHPSYTGLLLAFVGCGLMLGNWAGLLASFIVVLAALLYRIRVEEKALIASTGEKYLRFAASRSRLFPFLW